MILVSCNSGYREENRKWVWVSYDEAVGKRVTQIDEHDYESFEVMDNEKYARDKNSVFYNGRIIKNADPKAFKLIKHGYSKDENFVFLDDAMVIFANPKSFQPLEFPYSRDDAHIFCGTLPLDVEVDEIDQFKVTNENELMSSTTSHTLLKHFIEFHSDYQWLDTLNIEKVIIGEWATGETTKRKFQGYKESNKQ